MPIRILVPFDFTPAAERAIAWAAGLQRETRAEVLAVLVAPPPPDASSAWAAEDPLCEEDLASLRSELRVAAARHGADATGEVLRAADVGPAVVSLARAREVDMIVMGTRGRGTITRALGGGSVADYVTRHAECAVVTLRAAPPPRVGEGEARGPSAARA